MEPKITKIFHITTEGDCEGRTIQHLGYATGDVKDIKTFYEGRKYYDIYIREHDVIHITPEVVGQRKELEEEKAKLEQRLEYLKKVL